MKNVHCLNGKIVALHRFFPKSVDKCKTFFQLLKSPQKHVKWNQECKEVFSKLKNILNKLLILESPKGKDLIFYVASLNSAVSVVLTNQPEGLGENQRPIFYHSKALKGSEL